MVDVVALFLDPPAAEVLDAIHRLRPTLLQFHGREEDAFCRGFGLPYIKTLPMGAGVDPALVAYFSLPWVVFAFYAITRYRLFDIQIILSGTFTFTRRRSRSETTVASSPRRSMRTPSSRAEMPWTPREW